MKIFTITTIPRNPFNPTRCVGWFENYEDALEEVINNSCDIAEEGFYKYAVIEEFGSGIYVFPRKEFWFQWMGKGATGTFALLKNKPKKYNNTVCFSMG